MATPLAAALLLVLYFGLATAAVTRKSHTFDEIAHLTAGYAYWSLDDYRLHPENGNWPQRLGALPAVLGNALFPSLDDPAWRQSDAYGVGEQFFFQAGNDIDRMLWRGRAMVAILGAVLGGLVFAWSRRLHSPAGGWVSLVLFALCPTMLAHGALVTSDMAAALAFTASAGAVWMVLHRVNPVTVGASAATVAFLFLSKFSAPIVVPIAVGLAGIRLIAGGPLHVSVPGYTSPVVGRLPQLTVFLLVALVHVGVVLALIWASYGFRYSAFNPDHGEAGRLLVEWPMVLSSPDGVTPSTAGRVIDRARSHRLLPEAYLYGMAHSIKFSQSRRAFMNGEYSITGWRWFFPYAFAVKTTLPLLAMLALAAAGLVARSRGNREGESFWRVMAESAYRGAPLWILLLVYWAFAISTNLNIGHRHLLPAYPALLILAGGAGYWLQFLRRREQPAALPKKSRQRRGRQTPAPPQRKPGWAPATAGAAIVLVIAGWQAVESFSVRPHYLAYFNTLAGGPEQGYRRLVDSSLDWGQDLPGLKTWLDRNGLQAPGGTPVYLSYFGTSSPSHYGIDAVLLPGYFDRREAHVPVPLAPGWYCVSATLLQGVYLAASGPWTPAYEEHYQAVKRPALELLIAVETNDQRRVDALLSQRGEQYWLQALESFDQLRTARLMAYLRGREPTATIGYSILIYRLSEADVAQAQDGPPPYANPS